MSLTRTNSPLSKLIIRNIGDVGGPRSDHVDAELDNIIAWAKLSPRCIHRDTSTVGNVGAGLDSLHSFSLPANSLATNGDYLSVWYGGDFTANDTDKRVVASFGGTAYLGPGTLDIDGSVGWTITARIIRLSSTSVRVSYHSIWNLITGTSADVFSTVGGGAFVVAETRDITGLSDLGANATTMLVQGEGGANDDVTQNLSIIELTQQ